ncbi:heavy-metal-associated domain-containing protein [Arcobacter sp. CECT 8985]|uniref:heavy-metal-associated domain-containing protein n=1 Tax=Arcobacter sp. CECT 8985 TaxID=1935424 RepID=UPI00100B597E|nr:cation transporter [Arcobacter sp. CECT 8985]RXJ84858.1 hypothetical protein CRU93_12080 [Arcobacter sp. CECT 8985]
MKKIFLLLALSLSLFSKEVVIEISQMHCPLCTTMVKQAIKKVDGVNKVKVKLNTKNATVDFNEDKTDIQSILKAIKTTSYTGRVLK